MDKRREIPGSKRPNAAPKADVDRILQRFEQLGLDGEDAVEAAGFGRATYYRLKKYEASVGTVRKIDEWSLREANGRRKPSSPTGNEQEQLLAEWQRLGEQLMEADPARLTSTMDGVRDVLESVLLQQRAILKMLRATPGSDR